MNHHYHSKFSNLFMLSRVNLYTLEFPSKKLLTWPFGNHIVLSLLAAYSGHYIFSALSNRWSLVIVSFICLMLPKIILLLPALLSFLKQGHHNRLYPLAWDI